VRRGLAALVNGEEDMASCGETTCPEATIEVVARRRPDVVMIDVSVTRGEGLQVIQRIRNHDANIRIVALAMNDRPEFVERVFSAGAAMLVMKTDLALRVLETIRRSQAERKTGAPGRAPARAGQASGRNLDKTEREIVEMIGRGIPTRAIAMRAGMSVAMVEAHRRRISSKLNNPTASQLVQFCVRWVERARVPLTTGA
jgi:DNA-binding NarL/FixJ family response regulator